MTSLEVLPPLAIDPVASTALVIIVAGLVAYRLARALTTDSLFIGTRERLEAWAYVPDENGRPTTTWKAVRRTPPPRPEGWVGRWDPGDGSVRPFLTVARGKVADLLTCPFCCSMWFALGAVCLLARLWPWQLGWAGWLVATAAAGFAAFLVAADGRS